MQADGVAGAVRSAPHRRRAPTVARAVSRKRRLAASPHSKAPARGGRGVTLAAFRAIIPLCRGAQCGSRSRRSCCDVRRNGRGSSRRRLPAAPRILHRGSAPPRHPGDSDVPRARTEPWAILNGAGNIRSLESRIRSWQIGEEHNGGSVMLIRNLKVSGLLSFGARGIDLPLTALNVLIGPNGSGKSNLLEVLALLRAAPSNLPAPVREMGGVREWLWNGLKP